jgi:hypothetical protein
VISCRNEYSGIFDGIDSKEEKMFLKMDGITLNKMKNFMDVTDDSICITIDSIEDLKIY